MLLPPAYKLHWWGNGMKRDDDLIRSLMFEAEAAKDWRLIEVGSIILSPDPEQSRRAYHLLLLCDAGLFAQVGKGVFRLTNAGHDWVAAVRDDTVWARTKDAAGKVGGASLQLLGSIATAYVKQELSKLGIPIE